MASDVEDIENRVRGLEESVASLTRAVEGLIDEVGQRREPDEVVENFSTGARMKSKLKRGTETRDQEEHTIVGKGADAEEARAEYLENLEAFEQEIAQRVREIQPRLEEADDGE